MQQTQPLWAQLSGKVAHASRVAPRPSEAGNEPVFYRIVSDSEDDRNRAGCGFASDCRTGGGGRYNHRHLSVYQIGRHSRQPIVLPLRPAVFDQHGLAFDITGLAQALAEYSDHIGTRLGRSNMEKS